MQIDKRSIVFPEIVLKHGAHSNPEEGMCLMEAVAASAASAAWAARSARSAAESAASARREDVVQAVLAAFQAAIEIK